MPWLATRERVRAPQQNVVHQPVTPPPKIVRSTHRNVCVDSGLVDTAVWCYVRVRVRGLGAAGRDRLEAALHASDRRLG